MNIFDQLVFGDKHVEAVEEEKPDERNAPFEAEQHKVNNNNETRDAAYLLYSSENLSL